MTLLIAVLWAVERLPPPTIAPLQWHPGGSDIQFVACWALLITVVVVMAGAGHLLGWWLLRRVVSWEVAKRSLLDDNGKAALFNVPVVKWYEANSRDSDA